VVDGLAPDGPAGADGLAPNGPAGVDGHAGADELAPDGPALDVLPYPYLTNTLVTEI